MREFSGGLINYQSVDAIKKVHFNSISDGCCNLVDGLTVCDQKVGKRKRSNEHTASINCVGVQQEYGWSRSDRPFILCLSLIYSEEIYTYTREVILINLIVCMIFVSPLLDAIRC